MRFAVDTGGTFTDLVVEEDDGALHLFKSPTTQDDPVDGVLDVLATAAGALGGDLLARGSVLLHATTRAINAVLTGTISNYIAYPTISAGGRSTTVEAVVTLQVTLTNRATGAVIYTRPTSEYRERYEISADPKAYFDESGTGMQRLSKDVARSVVSAILEAF